MNPELKRLLDSMERFNEVNKSDIPTLVKLVRDLQASADLAWLQLEQNEQAIWDYREGEL